MSPETEVVENARWELLRLLACLRDCQLNELVPLFEGDWQNPHDDIWLAAQEAGKLGDIEFHDLNRGTDDASKILRNLRGGREAMVKITDQGYAAVKAHDVAGEVEQEPRP